MVWVKLFSIRAWWAHVTVTPEDKRIIVFRRGTWIALKGLIPEGGHNNPISIVGERLLWKNAQKKEKKNRTSEVIKRIMPQRNPLETTLECNPWNAPSREISRHHWYVVIIRISRPRSIVLKLN